MMRNQHGVTALSIFFGLGIIPSTASALAMAFPGAWSDAMWRLKPEAPAQFAHLGRVAIPLMIGVAVACAGRRSDSGRGRGGATGSP